MPGETVAYCETGYSQSCLYVNDVTPDDNVVVIDDVISTGGTMRALLGTLQEMNVNVLGVLLPIEKGEGAESLRGNTNVPITAMRHVDVEGTTVHIR